MPSAEVPPESPICEKAFSSPSQMHTSSPSIWTIFHGKCPYSPCIHTWSIVCKE
ncbi:hypothetical protein FOMG_17541 [Fusarium oxysporum f. sp. melonis 26406]|uniref:Uncharacterized protein n=1 Tax=Fusarium oxysporum f. sp. melonis 26406 TaxID=1089452 RepID=W9Z232_FUSOX|nr:hypothetical protein FOMG_17541 [Fusarium oxysporum f. sp. melonis 26406]